MARTIAEWIWRVAVLAALVWTGWELHSLHVDVMQPTDDTVTAGADPADTQGSLDEIRDSLAGLTQKVDAILVVMARAK